MGKVAAILSSVLALGVCLALYVKGMPSPQAGTIGMLVSLAVPPVVTVLNPRRVDPQ